MTPTNFTHHTSSTNEKGTPVNPHERTAKTKSLRTAIFAAPHAFLRARGSSALSGLRAYIAVSVTLFAMLGGLGISASSADGEFAWWHLTSGARPTYLTHKAGLAPGQTEVQEILTTPEEFEAPEQTNFTISAVIAGKKEPIEEFITEPLCKTFCPPATLLSAANIQKALEEKLYGAGNVTVEEVAVDKNGQPLKTGDKRYLITNIGEKANAAVQSIEVGQEIGTAESNVITEGKVPQSDGQIYVTAENVGDADAEGATTPVKLSDVLPPGLRAVAITGSEPEKGGDFQLRKPLSCTLATLTCTLKGPLAPYDQLEMRIAVVVEGASSGSLNEPSVSGGGAPATAIKRPVTISSQPTPFGVESYEMGLEEEGGAPTTQAGAHPFQLNTTITLNQNADLDPPGSLKPEATPVALTKDLHFKLPPGLIGNPTPIAQCTTAQFFAGHNGIENSCPPDTVVGVAVATVQEPATLGTATFTEPVFNLEPRVGEPARFGFIVEQANSPVFIDTAVRTGGDYGITVSATNITQTAAFLSSEVTFWGVPGDSRHDKQRGWGCLYEARQVHETFYPCTPAAQQHPAPFLSLPTSCTAALGTSVEGDSWVQPENILEFSGEFEPAQALDGCNRLQFAPQIKVAPDGEQASKPTGLTVDVHVPQEVNTNAGGLASSNVKDITVQFPEGVVLNPAAADGLLACSEGQVGFLGAKGAQEEFLFTSTLPQAFCPDASKIGTVAIKSPLLPPGQPVKGSLYLATPAPNGEAGNNPFNSLVSMYIVAEDPISGTLVKLPGSVSLNQATGQITATFDNNPQLAFEDAEIHLFGGERAPLATPSHCGTYTSTATFTPWSGTPPVSSQSSFLVTSGPNGGPCPPAALPFSPSLAAGTTNNNAGAFSPLSTTISREDGNQNIDKVQLHMPAGLSGILSGIPLCAEAQANAGSCSQASEIGHTVVSVGLGGDPFSVVGGEVFLTQKIAGSPADAPFGLSIVNPAVAGPFNLGKVIVRATIEVDPHTAQLTVTTTEIPHILDGVPLQIKHVNVTIDRPGFTFNPTNCSKTAVTGNIGSVEGASSAVAVPFQVTNCASLKFAPKFSVSTKGKNSKAGGATLIAKLSYPQGPAGTYANLTRVKVDLPKQLPSRLTTLQKACTNAQFELNPANCPKASKIGFAKVTTPLLPVPLEGPAIFVSHGGEAFPSLTMVLQGYGVTVDLVGTTFISSKGITSTTFKTVPDVPFNNFQLTLPQGKFSALAANVPTKAHYSLCGQTLTMPTEFLAQNGTKLNQSTKVSVTGCAKKKATKKKQKSKKKKSSNGKGGK
jgi:hypothetical protein